MNVSPELRDMVSRLTGPAVAAELNWSLWLDIVEAERLGAFLHKRATVNLPAAVQAELALAYHRESRDAFTRAAEMRHVLETLAGRIEFAVLKGAALLGQLYEDFTERSMWDLDLLLGRAADVETARDLLAREGFRTGKSLPGHHHAPALIDDRDVFGVELHTNFITPPLPDGLIADLWERRVKSPRGYFILDPVGQLIHHAIHALNDPVDSPLLRNLFETSWLARRVQPAEAIEVVTRWNVADPVARALGLAHELFGSPAILDQPPSGLLEFWCRRRLAWYGELSRTQRVLRHLARKHIEQMQFGASPRNVFPILGTLLGGVTQSLKTRLQRASTPPRRAAGQAVNVEDCLIFQGDDTGEVHLLNAEAARTFETMRGDHAVIRELLHRGVFTSLPVRPPTGPGGPRPSG